MGCDIHLHQEVKINGKWEHYALVTTLHTRNYHLFARMANVRNYDNEIEPISHPRGLPKDITNLTRFDREVEWGLDAHSDSWLSSKEIADLKDWYEQERKYDGEVVDKFMWFEDMFGFLFGNSWPGFEKYPDERPQGLEDVRWVFWFDN